MLLQKSLGVAFGLLWLQIDAQTTLDASGCQPNSPVTTFAACNYLYNQINYCAGPAVATGAPAVACYCNQNLFNAFFNCESEQRLCFGDDDNDQDFQTGIDQWHSACDNKITFSPTTPIVSSITSTYDQDSCNSAASACESGLEMASACSTSYTNVAQFSSCYCQPELLSLQYTCEYQLNTSCLAKPAALTNIPAYNYCSNAASVLGTVGVTNSLPASASASVTSSLPSSTKSTTSSGESSSSSITRPTLPGSSSSINPTAQSTSSSTNSGESVTVSLRNIAILVGTMVMWEASLLVA